MLSVKQLREIRKIGERMFVVYIDIYSRLPFAFDDTNPYGDDTVTYSTTAVRVKGWLVHPNRQADTMIDSGQVVNLEHAHVRVPVGTNAKPGDRVVIGTDEYYCMEATTEESWPEWISMQLKRIHR